MLEKKRVNLSLLFSFSIIYHKILTFIIEKSTKIEVLIQKCLEGSSDLVLLVRGPPGPGASKGVLESSLKDVWKILERIWLLAARAGAALSAVQADQGNLEKKNNFWFLFVFQYLGWKKLFFDYGRLSSAQIQYLLKICPTSSDEVCKVPDKFNLCTKYVGNF